MTASTHSQFRLRGHSRSQATQSAGSFTRSRRLCRWHLHLYRRWTSRRRIWSAAWTRWAGPRLAAVSSSRLCAAACRHSLSLTTRYVPLADGTASTVFSRESGRRVAQLWTTAVPIYLKPPRVPSERARESREPAPFFFGLCADGALSAAGIQQQGRDRRSNRRP